MNRNPIPIEDLLTLLKSDPLRNLALINLLEEAPHRITGYECYGNSVLLRRHLIGDRIYLSSTSESELRVLLSRLKPTDHQFAAVESWMLRLVEEVVQIHPPHKVYRLIFPDLSPLPPPRTPIRSLQIQDAFIVNDTWSFGSEQTLGYIEERIERGISAGIDVEGQLVAWNVTQDDGAIGCLYVLEPYRSSGYAFDVGAAVIHELRTKGKTPFIYIVDGNTKSLNLSKKMGFELDRIVYWIDLQH
jgi:GNAT superfamily N-acetyltransferase